MVGAKVNESHTQWTLLPTGSRASTWALPSAGRSSMDLIISVCQVGMAAESSKWRRRISTLIAGGFLLHGSGIAQR